MRATSIALSLIASLSIAFVTGCRSPKGTSVKEKRSYTLAMKKEALAELYSHDPAAKAHVARSPGYAVFSSVGSKIFMLATGSGFGVAHDNRTGKNTYMRMVEAGGGVGIGMKTYRAVYVFNERKVFEEFLKGSWQAAGDADVVAAREGEGTDVSVALTTDEVVTPVTVYQFTDTGVSLSAVATGTRYFPDDELN